MTFELIQDQTADEEEMMDLLLSVAMIDFNLYLSSKGMRYVDPVQQATARDVHLARIKELKGMQ
jgi:hypothetical protein